MIYRRCRPPESGDDNLRLWNIGPRLCAENRGESRAQVLEACDWYLSFPKIPSGADSRYEAESAPHPARCSDCEPWKPARTAETALSGWGERTRTQISGREPCI
jgi:hypothetical protein